MSSPRFSVEPRLVPAKAAARRLGLDRDEFLSILTELMKYGFPSPVPVVEHFDLKAIDTWLDRHSGLAGINVKREADATINARLDALG